MLIIGSNAVSESEICRFAWSSLRSFENIALVTQRLIDAHQIPAKHSKNARKQAADIRSCLTQAREYFDAAKSVSLFTKPTLLYYSIMYLAIAQILFKGSGDDSLERIREQNAHHGLLFSLQSPLNPKMDLRRSSDALCARPMGIGSRRKGTFEIWHRYARMHPLIGTIDIFSGGRRIRDVAGVIMPAKDERIGFLADDGITFYDCLLGSPCMSDWLDEKGQISTVVRATVHKTVRDSNDILLIAIHPHRSPSFLEAFKNSIMIRPRSIQDIMLDEQPDCFTIRIFSNSEDSAQFVLPPCSSWSTTETRFMPQNMNLNEFGMFYIGLFMLGNISRYYPDIWMKHVEEYTVLADAANIFMEHAEARMALLTLSDLTQKCYLRHRN